MSKWDGLTQKQWKAELQDLILNNDTALYRAIICIYENQTAAERAYELSVAENGVGFNKYDAEVMTRMAKQLKRVGRLSDKQKVLARKRMPKYWKQLMVVSKRNLAIK